MLKKITAVLLAGVMTLACVSALAENVKHERVFIVADPNGAVRSLTDTVRLENKDMSDVLADASLLTGIENMSGSETFAREGDAILWQAKGGDIVYQGRSDKAPALVPHVTATLDGEEVALDQLSGLTGHAVLTVSYPDSVSCPALALTVIPLPAAGISELITEHAAVVTEMGQRMLVGWAVPGADEALALPASFTVSFTADHADLGWMMTLISSDPIQLVCRAIDAKVDIDAQAKLDETAALLNALKDETSLPKTTGKTAEIAGKLGMLNSALTMLDSSASQLADSAKELSGGAAALSKGISQAAGSMSQLQEGLSGVSENSAALNAGADQLFQALLDSAGAQLAAYGLPALTPENYGDVLNGAIDSLDSAEAKAALSGLKDQLDQVHSYVGSLKAYTGAVDQVSAGASELNTGLQELKKSGSALSAGAGRLQFGASLLHSTGTQTLKNSILDAEKTTAEQLLPYVEKDLPELLRIFEQTRDQSRNGGYDLRPEGMTTVTAYIIRTDLR